MTTLSSERGSSSILLALLVVSLIVAAGVVAYNVSKWHDKVAQTGGPSPSPITSPTSDASPTATLTPAANAFVVREFGLQFTPGKDIKDLVYAVQTRGGEKIASFSTSSLEAADKASGGTYCTPEADAPLGGIYLDTSPSQVDRKVNIIGHQYLYYAGPQSACSRSSSAVNTLAIKQSQEFLQALSTAEAAVQ